MNGFEIVSLESHPYTLENSLVAIAQAGRTTRPGPASPTEVIRGAADSSASSLVLRDQRFSERLRDRGRVAMLGAGHLTGAFVNLYGLAERIEFVADDNPNKQGLFMPGSRLPILARPNSLSAMLTCA